MSEQTTQFVAGYWVDILLLAGLVVVACAFAVLCIIDRPRKKGTTGKRKPGTIDFEKPPFEVEYTPSDNHNNRNNR